MRLSRILFLIPILPAIVLTALADDPAPSEKPPSPLKWKKVVVDKRFQSEGANIADLNKTGKMAVVNGECYYEAPDWSAADVKPVMHRFRAGKDERRTAVNRRSRRTDR